MLLDLLRQRRLRRRLRAARSVWYCSIESARGPRFGVSYREDALGRVLLLGRCGASAPATVSVLLLLSPRLPQGRDSSSDSQVPAAPLSLASMLAGFSIALPVFGLPATWWMRKSFKKTRHYADPATEDAEVDGLQLQRGATSIKNAGHAIIQAQRAVDDLQHGLLRSLVSEVERQATQELARTQSVQIKGTREGWRETLREKHRSQRASLAKQLDAVDAGLRKMLLDQGVSPAAGDDEQATELSRAESKKLLAQYDKQVEEMSRRLKMRASSQSHNLEQKLEERRELMRQRLLQMERLMERQGLSGHIVRAPRQSPGASSAAVEGAKERQSRAVVVQKLDLTGDGHAESVGYDTTGDGMVDAIDYDGALPGQGGLAGGSRGLLTSFVSTPSHILTCVVFVLACR